MLQHFPAFHDENRTPEAAQAKFVGAAMASRSFKPFRAANHRVADHFTGNPARCPTGSSLKSRFSERIIRLNRACDDRYSDFGTLHI
jgi:hypothetical protein